MFSAIVLAAGKAERMGTLKQLLPWGDSTVLETVVNNLLACELIDDEIRVVLGAGADKISPIFDRYSDQRLKVLVNEDYSQGMLTTIKTGLYDKNIDSEYLMFALGDQPLISTDIFTEVIKEYLDKKPEILVPTYQNQPGHPVIITKNLLPEIDKLNGPGGLRSLFEKYPDKVYHYPIDDNSVVIDLDFYDEYKRYKKELSKEKGTINLNYKFWLEDGNKDGARVFGDGPCDILLRVKRYGSLSKAAADINMSYSQAWKLIKDLEEKLGFKLLEKQVGGASGGGSELTEKGKKLVNAFVSFRREVHSHINRCEKKFFNKKLWDELNS